MWKVILKMSIPMMLAQLVNALYNVVDRMYIGHIEDVGAMALTGLGLSMPVISVITAFSNLCGTGGGPLCAIARGEGDKEKAERFMGNAFVMLLLIGAVLTVALSVCLKDLLFFLGASEQTFPYAAEYLRIYLLGTLFVMISLGMNTFINAQGFAKIGMLTVVLGAVVNIVLDPFFILGRGEKLFGVITMPFGLGLGIAGAAWATSTASSPSGTIPSSPRSATPTRTAARTPRSSVRKRKTGTSPSRPTTASSSSGTTWTWSASSPRGRTTSPPRSTR